MRFAKAHCFPSFTGMAVWRLKVTGVNSSFAIAKFARVTIFTSAITIFYMTGGAGRLITVTALALLSICPFGTILDVVLSLQPWDKLNESYRRKLLFTAWEGVSKDTVFSSTFSQAPLVKMMTSLTFVVFLSICLGSTAGYRRALCPILSCPDAPEHCRQVFNYGWISNKWCPVSCQPVCECPTPAPWDLRHCGNRDPYCRVYRETVDLPDGRQCLIKCLLACSSG